MRASQGAVRAALVRVVRDPGRWPAASPFILRNQLLDEVGSDARPLVALLVRAMELDVPAKVRAASEAGRPWHAVQAPLVLTLVSDGFLQQDMARWAIDSWGVALGAALGSPALSPSTGPPRPRVNRKPVHRPVRRPIPAVPPPPPALRTPAPTRPARPRPAGRDPVIAWGGVLLFLLIGGLLSVTWNGARDAPPGASTTQGTPSLPSTRAASRTAAGVPGVTQRALPGSVADSARLLAVRPATRASGVPGPAATQLVRQDASVLMGTTSAGARTTAPDRAELTTGRVLVGRVEIVRAATVVFRDAASGIRYEFGKSEVKEIVTEYGTRVRFGRDGSPENHTVSSEFSRGVGGAYAVRYRVIGTRGSRECSALWQAPPPEDRADVVHPPGTDTLSIAFVGGATFPGVIDNEGRFATSFTIAPDQARLSTALTTRLDGLFTLDGFDAQVHVIAYRRLREGRDIVCQSTLGAVGTRIPTAASARR